MTTRLSQQCLSDCPGGTNLNSSRVSWIMFWMKWICREVRGAAPPCPTTSAMFWEREEDTAADRAEPEGVDEVVGRNKPFNSGCTGLWGNTYTHTHRFTCCCTSLNRRVIAQLGLNTVSSPEAWFWSEEGRGWLAKMGLMGWSGSGTNFPLQTGAAGFIGL